VGNNFVVIPARGGSKGVLNKNLIPVQGKNLVVRSINHARNLTEEKNIIISTDSQTIVTEIANYFRVSNFELKFNTIVDFGPFKLHYRDNYLSSDETLITEVLFSIRNLLIKLGITPNSFCLLQPTSPFRSIEDLRYIKDIISNNTDTKISIVSTCLVGSYHPARMYLRSPNGNLKELEGFSEFRASRRQDLPEVYIRDGGFYVIGDDLILNMKQYNKNPFCLIRNYPWTINIDGENDILIAQGIKNIDIQNDPNERPI